MVVLKCGGEGTRTATGAIFRRKPQRIRHGAGAARRSARGLAAGRNSLDWRPITRKTLSVVFAGD